MPAGQTDQGETPSASDHTLCWGSLPPGPTPPTTQLSCLAPSVLRGSPRPPPPPHPPPTPPHPHPPTLATHPCLLTGHGLEKIFFPSPMTKHHLVYLSLVTVRKCNKHIKEQGK